ncbi:PREDICTED: F-box/WD repeat-containing protein 4 isoform X2 [Dinoponera quadriceps]|uniref:F-box/WD repeat-containing protein 4 isoform X2 n=1 Tax=Dinoponera quadriceps TaxID=609295 RepID=A0A6P3WUD0_DINQU|nr:PREDICTED: F-box/WD repeat-containing protein 4 isoform X2 [Dinoponera quadriceps]
MSRNRVKMTDHKTNITTLPSELLIIIFEYCSAFDLVRLSQVCQRFHEIIKRDLLWFKKSYLPLATNQKSERFRERCSQVLCNRSKWRVSYNWQYGKYAKKFLLPQRMNAIPKIFLKSDKLWWCGNNLLTCFNRTKFFDMGNNTSFKCINNICDFSTFVLMRDFIVTGGSCGDLNYWLIDGKFIHVTHAHANDINAMDATSEVILTSSLNKVKIWSIKADIEGTKFAIGTSANESMPLQIYNIERMQCLMELSHNWRRGAGILDMVWEDPHTILSCGYDTFIRKWDMRCGRCVNSWADPTDATLYCISSDYHNTMIAGTQFNCMAVLWDQRQREYMQLYFMKCPGNRNKSPIYSLDFDSTHLYCTTDRYLVELDFYGNTKQSFNYNGMIK